MFPTSNQPGQPNLTVPGAPAAMDPLTSQLLQRHLAGPAMGGVEPTEKMPSLKPPVPKLKAPIPRYREHTLRGKL